MERYCVERHWMFNGDSNSIFPWERTDIPVQRREGCIEESGESINFDSRADTAVSKYTERTCRYTYRMHAHVTFIHTYSVHTKTNVIAYIRTR